MPSTTTSDLATWVETSLGRVCEDVLRARGLASSSLEAVFESFRRLRTHLAAERATYEKALQSIAGDHSRPGLVGTLHEILERFSMDIERLGQASAQIQYEVAQLRAAATEVSERGSRIEKVARTTRMISLNSRIEAHRMGSAGSTVQVFAAEIKALAEESTSLSNAIRDALCAQSGALARTSAVALEVSSSSNLDHEAATQARTRLDSTIATLDVLRQGAATTMTRIQSDVDAAVQALQVDDLLRQLFDSLHAKIESVGAVCASVREGLPLDTATTMADSVLGHDAVTQRTIDAGTIELF